MRDPIDEGFPERLSSLRETRARLPELVRNRHASRHRRSISGHDGRLLLVSADQPARGILGVRDEPMAMADRADLLRRLVIALGHPRVDGVIATADVIDDLLLLEMLEDRLAIGSMNGGGLVGSVFELDDRFTAYDAGTIAASHLDGGKMLCRIDPHDQATAAVVEACGHAVTELAGSGVIALIEPHWCRRDGGHVVTDDCVDAMIRAVTVASGLGARSSHSWLALPATAGLAKVMSATTLPVLVLAEDTPDDADGARRSWQRALAVPGVRGLVASRALLYPPDEDVAGAVDAAARIVHAGMFGEGGSQDVRSCP